MSKTKKTLIGVGIGAGVFIAACWLTPSHTFGIDGFLVRISATFSAKVATKQHVSKYQNAS